VRAESPITSNAEVDRAGVSISVNKGAAYDLYLTRSLKQATLVRGEDSFEAFLRDQIEVVAGVKQAVLRFAAENKGVALLDGRFMEIQQAMCLPKGREAAARYLHAFVEDMKASGLWPMRSSAATSRTRPWRRRPRRDLAGQRASASTPPASSRCRHSRACRARPSPARNR